MDISILFDLGFIIFLSAVLAYVARFLKQPLIIAYVLTGLILGPMGLGFITNTQEIQMLSELGIVFLLFSVGLEIDFRRFKHVGFAAFAGGVVQVALTFILGFAAAMAFGLDCILAVYMGLLLSFSSTMIVAKILSDKDELNTLHGRIMLGILLFQDIIAVVCLPLLKNMSLLVSMDFVSSIILRGLGLFAIAIILNKFFFPRILDYAAQRRDILFLTAVANCFFFIGASYILGFSLAIGGFIAGLSMANFPYNIEIVGEIHALRDFFSIVFFSSLGMQLNFWIIESMFPLFLTLLLLVMIAKPVILSLIYLFMGYGGRTSSYVGVTMGQASEFMFIIAAAMYTVGNITHEIYSLILSIVVISIVVTPYLSGGRDFFYEIFAKMDVRRIRHVIHPKSIAVLENPPEKVLENHTVLFGAHRMGEKIVQYLKDRGEKFVVVERDPEIVKSMARKGIYIRYGDAGNEDILKKIFLTKAKLVIITLPYADAASFVIKKTKRFNEKAKIIARAHTEFDAERLYKAGADIVIIPEFVSAEKIVRKVEHFLRGKGV